MATKNKTVFDYTSITASTEITIVAAMRRATHAPSSMLAEFHKACAFGAWLNWDAITTGWQNGGDSARLEALTQG